MLMLFRHFSLVCWRLVALLSFLCLTNSLIERLAGNCIVCLLAGSSLSATVAIRRMEGSLVVFTVIFFNTFVVVDNNRRCFPLQ